MKIEYTVTKNDFGITVISYEQNGHTYIFTDQDEANSDYQAYLKRDEPQVEHLTEIIPSE
jgi:hypothetical protein